MMVLQYLGALINRAAKGSVLLTDRLMILLVPFSTFVLWGLGVEMTDSLQETFWLGVAMTVTAVVALRFALASYQLWKEDQAEKKILHARYEHERTRPDRLQREAAHQYAIDLRNQLGEVLAKCVSYAEMRAKQIDGSESFHVPYMQDYITNYARVRDLLNTLSYDVPLRIICHELHHMCSHFVASGPETPDEDFKKMQKLKKIAFRVIYKMDANDTAELLSLAEAENLLGKMQYPDSPLADLQRAITDSEFLAYLRREINAGNTNGY